MEELPTFSDFLSYIAEYGALFSFVFVRIWWVLVIIFLWFIFYFIWWPNKQAQYASKINYMYLAVSIPEESELNPKSMEQVFTGLHAIKSGSSFVEKWFKGKHQDVFSFELVSIAGNTRYIIRLPDYFRDFVEANIYAYYPDAEIMEVEDYAQFIPGNYPNDEYNVFGAEFGLAMGDSYPIKTYKNFADEIEQSFIDPIAALLEVMGRIGDGEQMWLQLVASPVADDWHEGGKKIVNQLAKRTSKLKDSLLVKGVQGVVKFVEPPSWGLDESSSTDREQPSALQHMTPGEVEIVKAIESNISKIGFSIKFRIIYVAKKDVFDGKRGVNPFFGAIKLFGSSNLNSFVPSKTYWTLRPYFADQRVPRLQRNIVRRYKDRDMGGLNPFILSVEELATVYHFPYLTVKAPTLIRSEAKKGVAPTDLPIQ